MKKIMHKTVVRQLFLLLLLSGIVFACVYDNDPFGDSGRHSNGNRVRQPLSPEAIAARAWLESEVGREFLTWHPGTDETRMLMPNWQRTFSNENSRFRVTEARIRSGSRVFFQMDAEVAERYRQTNNRRYRVSDTRFVLRTDIETGETVGFVMIVHPDLAQIQRSRNPLRSFTYLEREKDFSGFVFFYNLNGEFVNGWWQKNGRFYPIFSSEAKENYPQLRSGAWITRCFFQSGFKVIYENGERVSEEYLGTTRRCEDVWMGGGNPPSPGDDDPWPPHPDPDPENPGWDGGFWPPWPPSEPQQPEEPPQPPVMPNEDPCRNGRPRAQANRRFFANPTIQNGVHYHFMNAVEANIEAMKAGTALPYGIRELAMSIGRDANGNYILSDRVRVLPGESLPPKIPEEIP